MSRIHRGVLVFLIIWALCVPIGLFWGLTILIPPLALNPAWHRILWILTVTNGFYVMVIGWISVQTLGDRS